MKRVAVRAVLPLAWGLWVIPSVALAEKPPAPLEDPLVRPMWNTAQATPPPAPEPALPPHYYVDADEPDEASSAAPTNTPASDAGAPPEPPPPMRVYEPPPPYVYEPPPPLRPRHVAPEYSLWVGGRIGSFHPFGNAWGECTVVERSGVCLKTRGVPWSDYAASGMMGELDIGARLGRRHVLFFGWERASLGPGALELEGSGVSQRGETDFFGVGLRFSSNPNSVGLLIEIMVGARRFRVAWDDGSELLLENAPFESRIGIGADIRLSKLFSLTPLITLGGGQFGDVTFYDAASDTHTEPSDLPTSHAWVTLQVGAHFDLFGSY
ncbi:MAG: hypothetical protein KIT72_17560 [Polyangiaceae bacterium]|nr:hypothetical protein [Polyangiaceae bacterium]MCW5792222.1 hypothetical protein [Polyangiaceae bacterium]